MKNRNVERKKQVKNCCTIPSQALSCSGSTGIISANCFAESTPGTGDYFYFFAGAKIGGADLMLWYFVLN